LNGFGIVDVSLLLEIVIDSVFAMNEAQNANVLLPVILNFACLRSIKSPIELPVELISSFMLGYTSISLQIISDAYRLSSVMIAKS
jgi:hypothetical protein